MPRSIAIWDNKAERRLLDAHRRWGSPEKILQNSAWLRHRFSLQHIEAKLPGLLETQGNTSHYGLKGESEEDDGEEVVDKHDERKFLRKHIKDIRDTLIQAEIEMSPIYLHAKGYIYAILPLPLRAKVNMKVSVAKSLCTLDLKLPPLNLKEFSELGISVQTRKETLSLKKPLQLPESPKRNIRYDSISRVEWHSHTAIWRIPHGDATNSSNTLKKVTTERKSFRV
jgi:hypothetical protein